MKKRIAWWTALLTVISTIVLFSDGVNVGKDLWDKYVLKTHQDQVLLFEKSSAIVDHRFDGENKLYLKYVTCHPPSDTPEYYYIVWLDGNPVGGRRPAQGHYSINSWFKPIYCTEGWWGNVGFPNAQVGSEIVVTWYWLLDDGNYKQTNMRYFIK